MTQQRHPARTLRVPGPGGGGLHRVAAGSTAPRPLAAHAPAQGGSEPAPLPAHQARLRKTKAPKTRHTSHSSHKSRQTPATTQPAASVAADASAALAAWFDDLTYMAGQPGSYQRMGGF
jgi:hypothetical protein